MRRFKTNSLKSFLFVCICLIIATFANANVAMEVPGPPGVPYITRTTSASCDIKYDAPKRDGGSKIVSYDIECRVKDSDKWINKGSSRKLTHTVVNLTEGDMVEFRVIASNKVGKSAPSRASQLILITGQH